MANLEDNEDISKVLFELSSNRRANILFKIEKENLKMRQIAKSLDMTVTETFRHLQRLIDANLVEKKADGAYAITSLGNLAIGFLSGFNFILKNSTYFLEHGIHLIPYEFVNRLGELSKGEFCTEVVIGFNRVRKMVFDAEKYIWVIAEQVDSSHVELTKERKSKGLDFKFLMQEDLAKTFSNSTDVEVLVGSRFMERIPVTLVITENYATVVFRRLNGVMDYMGIFGTDLEFRKWCEDLFLYYWERAERWYPGIQIK
jgi:predicted transcriptional regulator